MPAERTTMRQVREVLRLRFVGGVTPGEGAEKGGPRLSFNEGKVCDAIVRRLEEREHRMPSGQDRQLAARQGNRTSPESDVRTKGLRQANQLRLPVNLPDVRPAYLRYLVLGSTKGTREWYTEAPREPSNILIQLSLWRRAFSPL